MPSKRSNRFETLSTQRTLGRLPYRQRGRRQAQSRQQQHTASCLANMDFSSSSYVAWRVGSRADRRRLDVCVVYTWTLAYAICVHFRSSTRAYTHFWCVKSEERACRSGERCERTYMRAVHTRTRRLGSSTYRQTAYNPHTTLYSVCFYVTHGIPGIPLCNSLALGEVRMVYPSVSAGRFFGVRSLDVSTDCCYCGLQFAAMFARSF